MPDFHKGDSLVNRDGFFEKVPVWLGAHPVDEVVAMLAETCNKFRGEGKKIGTVGFCWGTWVQYRAMKHGIVMDGAVCMHPSIVAEDMQGGNHSDLIKFQNCPVMIAAAGNDVEWTKPG